MLTILTFSPLERNSHIGIAEAVTLKVWRPNIRTTTNSITVLKFFIFVSFHFISIFCMNSLSTRIVNLANLIYYINITDKKFIKKKPLEKHFFYNLNIILMMNEY